MESQQQNNRKKVYVFFGAPGAGKSTQALLLKEKLNLYNISWGKLSREIAIGIGAYKKYQNVVRILDKQDLSYPKGFIINIIEQEIKNAPLGINGIIIEGFPRRKEEALELLSMIKSMNLQLHAAVRFNIDFETVKKRIENRQYCPKCGRFYNDLIRPKKLWKCDKDDTELTKRDDDSPNLLRSRYNEYIEESIEAYTLVSSCSKISFDINANNDESVIFATLIGKLNSCGHTNRYHFYNCVADTTIETTFGKFYLLAYQHKITFETHLILYQGDLINQRNVPLRVHSSCITGDIFHSKHCDCDEQLHTALKYINSKKKGVLIYLFQEGRGINIINKIKTYKLQRKGVDTVDANIELGFPPDLREYSIVKEILDNLRIKSVDLMTNNPDKICQLQDTGVIIENRIPIVIPANPHNEQYLHTKAVRMGHMSS